MAAGKVPTSGIPNIASFRTLPFCGSRLEEEFENNTDYVFPP